MRLRDRPAPQRVGPDTRSRLRNSRVPRQESCASVAGGATATWGGVPNGGGTKPIRVASARLYADLRAASREVTRRRTRPRPIAAVNATRRNVEKCFIAY